ncbi:hypothetical protein QBC39DRAFT_352591 [Podospora conica]|nr:hypothetical protein QBC39DRAFT_352591 [Schizothecium conicum]
MPRRRSMSMSRSMAGMGRGRWKGAWLVVMGGGLIPPLTAVSPPGNDGSWPWLRWLKMSNSCCCCCCWLGAKS